MSASIVPSWKIRVGVLRGGPSSQYDHSLKTGASVLRNLPSRFEPQDVFISKAGEWHMDGLARSPEKILSKVDVAFVALHGEYGEDGKVQRLLEGLNVPYTGSDAFASALGMNKHMSKKAYAQSGLRTPLHFVVRIHDDVGASAARIVGSVPMPVFVKPASSGGSLGTSIAWDIVTLERGIVSAFAHSEAVIVEEYVKGREATCAVVERFRGQRHYTTLPVEIVPGASAYFDADEKGGRASFVSPGTFSIGESREMQELAAKAHRALGMRHYSRSDFIVSPDKGVYLLETNSHPGLAEHTAMPHALESVGCPYPQFLDHLLTLALEGRRL